MKCPPIAETNSIELFDLLLANLSCEVPFFVLHAFCLICKLEKVVFLFFPLILSPYILCFFCLKSCVLVLHFLFSPFHTSVFPKKFYVSFLRVSNPTLQQLHQELAVSSNKINSCTMQKNRALEELVFHCGYHLPSKDCKIYLLLNAAKVLSRL